MQPVLAVAADGGAVAESWEGLTAGQVLWQIFVIVFFVVLNGFFVAAEFAIVKVRLSELDTLIDTGRRGAKLARHVRENLDSYLSANQLGITLASIALGFLGEAYVMRLIQPVFYLVSENVPEGVVRGTSFAIAYGLVTFMHVTVGEQAPKILGLQKAARISLVVARPLQLFYTIFKPAIWMVNEFSNFLLRVIFRIDPGLVGEKHHSAEELALLVAETEASEVVTDTEREILINALELNDLAVRDIMMPRSDVISLDQEDKFADNLRIAVESKHTRFPLIKGHLDEALGQIHIKDLITLIGQEKPDLNSIVRELLPVPEMMPLDRLLKFFLNRHAHLALVVDEFGGALGIVTLDNVLEELVGDIQDEFDEDEKEFQRINDDEFLVEGSLGLYELSDLAELELDSPDVSTVGGYVTHLMGHLPKVGESVIIEDYDATITKTDGRRVVQLRFVRKVEAVEGEEAKPEEEVEARRKE